MSTLIIRNTNQNINEISPQSRKKGIYQNARNNMSWLDMVKKELSFTSGDTTVQSSLIAKAGMETRQKLIIEKNNLK